MTPSPSATTSSRPSPTPPTTSQRRDSVGNCMRSRYNNGGSLRRLFLLTGQTEDVPVILGIRTDEEEPVAGLERRLGLEDALTVGAVHRDGQLDALLTAIAQHQ